jgi:N-methylhydantoinase B
MYALVAFVDAHPPINGGVRRVVEATFRRGSVVCATYPCASGMYMASCTALAEAALQALSAFDPAKRHALNGGTGGNVFAGKRGDGAPYVQYELIGSAYGGSIGMDGASGISALLTNAATSPVEILESEFPTRLQCFELTPDSGGAGRYRGGLAPRRYYEILADGTVWTVRGGRNRIPASGIDGGFPGRLGRCVRNPDTPEESVLPSRFSNVALDTGDVAAVEKPGGGGVGDPKARPFEEVLDDVIDGYVTRDAAIEIYGVDPQRLDAELAAWA